MVRDCARLRSGAPLQTSQPQCASQGSQTMITAPISTPPSQPIRGVGRGGRGLPRGGGRARYIALPARTEVVASDSISKSRFVIAHHGRFRCYLGHGLVVPPPIILYCHAKIVTLNMPGIPRAEWMVDTVPVVRDFPDMFPADLSDSMDQRYQLPFEAGQSAEARSFEVGYRGAWFRCKIKEISRRGGHWKALLEYFDYPDESMFSGMFWLSCFFGRLNSKCQCSKKMCTDNHLMPSMYSEVDMKNMQPQRTELTWTELYQVPPYQSGKSKEIRQLILRPEYPPTHLKSKVSDVTSTSDVTIVTDGTWKAGDLVDWWTADCYWFGKLTKLLGNGKAEIELVPPPLGEGATYEVFVKDLRPSLDWSPEFVWAVPASQDGENRRGCARLLKPVSQERQGMVVNRPLWSSRSMVLLLELLRLLCCLLDTTVASVVDDTS
uniref:Uncharacterized protein LOC104225642 n=1 Tax=Nicotiana sylvestris TaxID=4096 RepID=A0A1U7WAX0_NICSY|nr:PREDICTED: uncharacterized protein LOC104225642 [Nicotiana sylvestris]